MEWYLTNDMHWMWEVSDSDSDDDFMIPPSNPSGGWHPRHKTDEFHIRVADQIDRVGGLANSNLQKLCEQDVYSWGGCPMCSQGTHMDFSCLRCLTRYCSLDCRKNDRHVHKRICGKIYHTPHVEKGRPSPNAIQALIFPAQGKSPIQVWVKMNYREGDNGKLELVSLSFKNDEFWSFATQFKKAQYRGFRMGCINECSMLRHRRLGKGLFILEWALNYDDPTQSDIPLQWLNKSISRLGPPGHMWYWTGPILILACDPARCKFSPAGKPTHLALEDFEPRDMRSVADFFQLNLRNPVIIDPLGRRPNPFDFDYTYAYKINDIFSPVARLMGVREPVERVRIAFNAAQASIPQLQAPSLLANLLGLNYVLRNPHNHGPEFSPTYRRLIMPLWNPHWLGIIRPNEATKGLTLRKDITVPATDTIIFIHRSGLDLPKEYIDAMLKWVPLTLPNRQLPYQALYRLTCERIEGGKKLFGMFWDKWREEEQVKPQKKGDEFRRLVHPLGAEEAMEGWRTFCIREYKMIDAEFAKLKKEYLKMRQYARRRGMSVEGRKGRMGEICVVEGDGIGAVVDLTDVRGKVEDKEKEKEKVPQKDVPSEKVKGEVKPMPKGILKNAHKATPKATSKDTPKDKGKGKADPMPKGILKTTTNTSRDKGKGKADPMPKVIFENTLKDIPVDKGKGKASPAISPRTTTDTDIEYDTPAVMDPDALASMDAVMGALMKEVTDYLEDLEGRRSSGELVWKEVKW